MIHNQDTKQSIERDPELTKFAGFQIVTNRCFFFFPPPSEDSTQYDFVLFLLVWLLNTLLVGMKTATVTLENILEVVYKVTLTKGSS